MPHTLLIQRTKNHNAHTTTGTVLTKGDVNGESARPTYKFVRAATGLADVKWNFMASHDCLELHDWMVGCLAVVT